MRASTSIFLLVAALVPLTTSIPASPRKGRQSDNDISTICPDIFSYQSYGDKPGQWTGTLLLQYEVDLRGLWIRLVFDKAVRLEFEGDYEQKQDENDKTQVLIKNRNVTLKAHQIRPLKITVKYEGDKAASLIEYRLNARTICPEHELTPSDFYQGDFASSDFLDRISSAPQPAFNPYPHCGEISSSSNSPWHASLFIKDRFVCEATLLDNKHVLTAAHCVSSKNAEDTIPRKFLTVYLGENGAAKSAIRANVSSIKLHPGYEGLVDEDVAVLKFTTPVEFGDNVRPICLGDGKQDGSFISGYDVKDDIGAGEVKASKVFRISDEDCIKKAEKVKNALTDKSFCVAYESDNSNCAGNSGSSFISLVNNKATLRGFVSVGVKLQNKNECDKNAVAVVTDVARCLKWILKQLAN